MDDVLRRKEQICQDSDSTEDMKFFAEYICKHLDLAEHALADSEKRERERENGRAVLQSQYRRSAQDVHQWSRVLQEIACQTALNLFFQPSMAILGLMNNPKDTAVNGKSAYARVLIQKKASL